MTAIATAVGDQSSQSSPVSGRSRAVGPRIRRRWRRDQESCVAGRRSPATEERRTSCRLARTSAPKSNVGPEIDGRHVAPCRVRRRRCRRRRWYDDGAVARQAERRRQRAGASRARRRRATAISSDEDGQRARRACSAAGRPRAKRVVDVIHGEPPFEARPCRALSLRPGPPQDGIEVIRHPMLGIRVEPVGDGAVEARRSGSCRAPLTDVGPGSSVGVERRSHLPEPAIQAGLGRAQRDPQRRGDLRQRQVEVVMQDDDRPLLGLEPAEAAFELVAVGDRRRGVGDGGGFERSVMSTSRRRRRTRRISSMQAFTSSRCNQASNRSGSRSVGRSRQARTSAFWTASVARSVSRSMSQAVASRREIAAPASSAKAS